MEKTYCISGEIVGTIVAENEDKAIDEFMSLFPDAAQILDVVCDDDE